LSRLLIQASKYHLIVNILSFEPLQNTSTTKYYRRKNFYISLERSLVAWRTKT